MSALDRILKNCALFIDGRGYFGQCETVTLPKLVITREDFRGGGMDAPVGVQMGMEKLTLSFTFFSWEPKVMSLWGIGPGRTTPFVFRGALQDLDGKVRNVEVYCRGQIAEEDSGELSAGAKTSITFTADLFYYRRMMDGQVIDEIDPVNMKRIVGGVDQLAEIRSAIGML